MRKKKRKRTQATGSLALCMIVKDEEANLGRCLESVRGLVSEIDIVDTGSGDDTIGIARRSGARVRSEQWVDDFSRARNVSLEMAEADWILVLDADEVLSPDAIPKIKAALRNRSITGFTLPTRNYTNDSAVANFVANDGCFEPAHAFAGWVESRKVRLFRRLSGIRFDGEIHELVEPSIRSLGGRTEFLDAIVHHFGYLAPEDSIKEKAEKRLSLAEAKCANQRNNYKAHYELGIIWAHLGNLAKAEQSLRASISLRNDFVLAHYDLGVVLSRAGREEEAVSAYRATLEYDPGSFDAAYNLAVSLQKLRRDSEAERAYRSLLERWPSDKRGWNNLGALLGSTGRLAEAEQALNNALRIDPNCSDARRNLRSLQELKSRGFNRDGMEQEPPSTTSGISLCMIVRNEEENLQHLLRCVERVVDEIIIVDTGSSDRTVEVASSHGANIYEFQWTDDFAAARNFSLSKATHEWILVLDADEALSTDDFEVFRDLIRNTHVSGYSFQTRNYSRDSSLDGWRPASGADEMARSFPGWFPSEKVRLFRNTPSIRFEGAIHELVEPSIARMGGIIERARIPIHHYGYDGVHDKAQGYLAAAMQKVSSMPDDAEAHFQFGSVLHRLDRLEEACASLMKAVELAPGNAEYLVVLGDSLRAARNVSEAEHAYQKAIALRPNLSVAYRGLGLILFGKGAFEASRTAFESAVALNPNDAQSLTNIGVVHTRLGNNRKASEYFSRALEINPQNDTARNNLKAMSASSSGSNTLCLLMIVRDEQENLGEMLPPLASCFDEIVIVDTGSHDTTVEIARRHTDKVFTCPWTDDFSAARNFGLAKVQAGWVLWLDADDRITPREVTALRRHIGGAKKGYLIRVSSGTNGSDSAEFLQLRLFPNFDGIGWEGRVHEQILPSLEREGLALEALSDVIIVHKGYGDPATLEKKTRRNLRLLEKERDLSPGDPRVLQHLAQAYAMLGEIEKAIETSEALVNAQQTRPRDAFLSHTLNRLVQYQLLLNNTEAAKGWAGRVLDAYPQDRLVRYYLGEICYREGLFHEAVTWLEQFCDAEDIIGCVPVPWQALTANARNYLGLANERIGRRDRACAEFRKAIQQGARIEAYKNLARIHLEDGDPSQAASVLRAATEMQDADVDAWTNLGVALARSHKSDEAAGAFRRALELDPACAAAGQNLRLLENQGGRTSSPAKSFTLSVCIIARDEASCLKDAIESVMPISDEIIVVDTGSTDDTAETARSCGAVVETVEWTDDFSAARNVTLELARYEWILVIDADEIIDSRDLEELAAFTPDPDIWGYSMVTRNYSSDRRIIGWQPAEASDELARGQSGWFPSTKVRLFRNLPEIRFQGRIHECVEPAILAEGKRIGHLDIPIHHYGSIRDDKKKCRYYLHMAELKARENSEDARAHYELGIQQMVLGNLDDAETSLTAAAVLDPNENLTLLNLACVKMELDKFEEARELLEKAVALNPSSACSHYNLGVALEKTGRFEAAEDHYSKASVLDPKDSNALAKRGYLTAAKGEMETARKLLEQALKLDPTNEHAHNNLEYVRDRMSARKATSCDLSLNMIVRDEEKNLREGLAPIAELFDEIVVVDTGSHDGTVEVVEGLGARVIHHPWNDNFSEARNAALKSSNGRWVFWLDADDRISPQAVQTLRKFITRRIPCGVFFPIECRIGRNGSILRNYTLRLFPNTREIGWTGAVHEQIAGSLRSSGIELVNCPDFTIRHVGYENEEETLKKNLRNLKLLAREVTARPEDPHVLFALAQAFLFCGQMQHAAKWLRVLWKTRGKMDDIERNEIFWMAAVILSDCSLREGNTDEADAWLEHAIQLWPDQWLPHFLLGERAFLRGAIECAAQSLRKAEKIGIGPTILPLDIDGIQRKLECLLAEIDRKSVVGIAGKA